MKLLVSCDAHVFVTPDGKHWSTAIYGYSFWKRYLKVFDSVRIVAKMKSVDSVDPQYRLMDGDGVEIFGLPYYRGPKELLKKYRAIQKKLQNVAQGCDAALLRMPSPVSQMVYKKIRGTLPIAGEIVYDPMDDVCRKGDTLVIHLLNCMISRQLKAFCRHVNGVSYVTQDSIQRHYPSRARLFGETKEYFEDNYSTITLSDDAFTGPRDYAGKKSLELALSCVAMQNDRKGEKTLIKCVQIARDRGYDVSAVLIGDGSMRKVFEEYAAELGISQYVEFTGLLSSPDAVRQRLQKADVFVFPTQAEGLPRGILEAMATGMPILSTPVGGIPEVLEKKYMFDPFDAESFAKTICRLMDNPDELNQMSTNNFTIAQDFKNTILQARRERFYRKLKALV